ncbi:MAG: hypothetical protein J0L75_01595 [Spirochaetes bacterium]|nr:hypothetical protein [Spirochaetota bacterium]
MGFLFSAAFWGVIIILFGLAVILKAVFHIDLPIFRILFGVLLIYVGARIIAGGRWLTGGVSTGHSNVFGSGEMKYDGDSREYSCVFSSSTVNLKDLPAEGAANPIRTSTVFGKSVILLPKNLDLTVQIHTAFGSTLLPDGTQAPNFGDTLLRTKPGAPGTPKTRLEVNTVFGQTVLVLE